MPCFKLDVKAPSSAPVSSVVNSIDAVTFSQRSPSLTNILVGQADANRRDEQIQTQKKKGPSEPLIRTYFDVTPDLSGKL